MLYIAVRLEQLVVRLSVTTMQESKQTTITTDQHIVQAKSSCALNLYASVCVCVYL
jgi:hypothetical protein